MGLDIRTDALICNMSHGFNRLDPVSSFLHFSGMGFGADTSRGSVVIMVSDCQQYFMKNIEMVVEGKTLTIKVDLSKEFGESKSGKSFTIATTEGNISIPDNEDIKIGLNIYRKKQA